MNTDRLKYFVDSAELKSFSAAASKHYISQTAISKQIHTLEQELNSQLFKIENNKIQLTNAGRFFYSKAKLILNDLSVAVAQTEQLSQTESQTLRIGFTTSFESITAAKILMPFQQVHPDISLFPVQQTYQQGREGLSNQTLDIVFAIDYGIATYWMIPLFRWRLLKKGEMILGINSTHHLAQKTFLDGQELTDETIGFYNFDGTTPAPFGMVTNAQRDGYVIEHTRRYDRLEELLLNVSLNNCITFVPEGFDYANYPNIVYRHIKNTSHLYQIGVFVNKQNNNPAVKQFVRAFESVYHQNWQSE
ncbi:LysR family transcriptional regulator [Secundilactobacillus collinoides]|uniref:LysR family transcriptional regulator n=1 Tax=Secundilactobacillus collinoides TaxID=33960 RepID=UPI0006D09295|nr:LysR family transcriptional regulator [Secundilactobacillus collinoides]